MTRDEAIQVLTNFYVSTKNPKANHLCEAVYIAIQALKSEPIKHGRWIKGVDEYDGIEMCKCSECGYLNLECEVFQLDGFRYCPNCGAKMDEVEE